MTNIGIMGAVKFRICERNVCD